MPHHHTERWQPCHTSYVAILSDTSYSSTSELKPWNSDGTENVQWGGCVCFNLATRQCEVLVLKTKLRLPFSSFRLQSMSQNSRIEPLKTPPHRTIWKHQKQSLFVWCLQLWKSWNKISEHHICCFILAAEQSWGVQVWESWSAQSFSLPNDPNWGQ